MPWDARYVAEPGIVETTFSGRVDPTELRQAALTSLEHGKKNGTSRFLVDCSRLEGGHSVVDLYGLLELLVADPPSGFREAVLMPHLPAPRQEVEFWEMSCANRGLLVRIFSEREPALTWLLGLTSEGCGTGSVPFAGSGPPVAS